MIFAGQPLRIFSAPYLARMEHMEKRERRSLEQFLDCVWTEREPIAPIVRGKWPLERVSDLFREARVDVTRLPAKARR